MAMMLIDNPDVTVDELMQLKGRDFPTGALILGREGIKKRTLQVVLAA